MNEKTYGLVATLGLITAILAGVSYGRTDLPDLLIGVLLGIGAVIAVRCTIAAAKAGARTFVQSFSKQMEDL